MESKVSRLTHEVVDGVCLHLSVGDANLLKHLIELGASAARKHHYTYWAQSTAEAERVLREFSQDLLGEITKALAEDAPACKK